MHNPRDANCLMTRDSFGKRQRTAALQDASRIRALSPARQRLGVRLSSAAFELAPSQETIGFPTVVDHIKCYRTPDLRRTSIPAVLVECGFLTNPTEAQYAESANYRQKLAEEIAGGIRGRGSVASAAGSTRLAANSATVPLQPFIDQTRVRDPDISRSKRSAKRSSKSKSSKSRKKSSVASDDSEAAKTKPSRKKKHIQSSDDESSNTKKKSSPNPTED